MRRMVFGPIDPYLGGMNTDGPPDPPEYADDEGYVDLTDRMVERERLDDAPEGWEGDA